MRAYGFTRDKNGILLWKLSLALKEVVPGRLEGGGYWIDIYY